MPDWPIGTTSISGQPVALTSGTAVTSQSGINVVVQSGLGVTGTFTVSVSNQPVQLVSGTNVPLSGLQVITQNLSGTQIIIQSGQQFAYYSGESLRWSGLGVLAQSGLFVQAQSGYGVQIQSISGLPIVLQSGQQVAQFSGEPLRWSGIGILLQSGLNVVTQSQSGIGVIGDFTANISGQAVFISGTVNILSGAYVNVGSGIGVVGTFSASISGQPVALTSGTLVSAILSIYSGLNVYQAPSTLSGQYVIISGQGVAVVSGLFATINIVSGITVLSQTASGETLRLSGLGISFASGIGVIAGTVTTSISNQSVQLSSGTLISTIMSIYSGLAVVLQSGITSAPGQSGLNILLQSGQVVVNQEASGSTFRNSGLYVNVISPGIRTRSILKVTTASGGVTLDSGDIHSVTVKSLSGAIYVGGAQGMDYPYSGYGMLLAGGEAITLDTVNFNLVSVCAATSGDPISYIGII